MLGKNEAYDRVPYFYSDQFDRGMELFGRPQLADRVVVRREPADDAFLALWLRADEIVAAMHANAWDAKAALDRLVRAAARVDLERFATGATLEEIVPVAA